MKDCGFRTFTTVRVITVEAGTTAAATVNEAVRVLTFIEHDRLIPATTGFKTPEQEELFVRAISSGKTTSNFPFAGIGFLVVQAIR